MSDPTEAKLYDQGLLGPILPDRCRLEDRWVISPFSVLNTREGYWQDRKRRWVELGIESEVGRDSVAYHQDSMNRLLVLEHGPRAGSFKTGTSVFDPVLCELVYRWWCPQGGVIVDPFAGGSVRGIVASVLGFKYWGCELRAEQVQANLAQLSKRTVGNYRPKWIEGDSRDKLAKAPQADLIFSCPPYGSLEKYSDNPKDISAMPYGAFVDAYHEIIRLACERLRDNRFACFVVANYREGEFYRNLVADTVAGFAAADCHFYNDIILVNAVGTAAMRSNTCFVRGKRKVVKVHQNVLVFAKGCPRKAADNLKDLTE